MHVVPQQILGGTAHFAVGIRRRPKVEYQWYIDLIAVNARCNVYTNFSGLVQASSSPTSHLRWGELDPRERQCRAAPLKRNWSRHHNPLSLFKDRFPSLSILYTVRLCFAVEFRPGSKVLVRRPRLNPGDTPNRFALNSESVSPVSSFVRTVSYSDFAVSFQST